MINIFKSDRIKLRDRQLDAFRFVFSTLHQATNCCVPVHHINLLFRVGDWFEIRHAVPTKHE